MLSLVEQGLFCLQRGSRGPSHSPVTQATASSSPSTHTATCPNSDRAEVGRNRGKAQPAWSYILGSVGCFQGQSPQSHCSCQSPLVDATFRCLIAQRPTREPCSDSSHIPWPGLLSACTILLVTNISLVTSRASSSDLPSTRQVSILAVHMLGTQHMMCPGWASSIFPPHQDAQIPESEGFPAQDSESGAPADR